ncbi:hypothetical protein UlMin_044118 [Ulmus minor]
MAFHPNINKHGKHLTSFIHDSDDDLFRVPEVEEPPIHSPLLTTINKQQEEDDDDEEDEEEAERPAGKQRRSRGRNPADKEYRRMKRLLRNRVSAQQARERKKLYVNDLESRATQLEQANTKLQENISTFVNENAMLRKLLINTRPNPNS